MDIFGTVAGAAGLIQHTFHLYRHVSASRNFADSAGSYAAMIAFEYFRFEMWMQQSSLLSVDESDNPTITDASVEKCIQAASNQTSGPIDYKRLESNILRIFGEVFHVLQDLKALRIKYSIDPAEGDPESTVTPSIGQPRTSRSTTDIIPKPSVSPSTKISKAILSAARRRQDQSNRVSFFRKVNFTWALKDDVSDKEKLFGLIQNLKYWNDALREMLPLSERKFSDAVVSVRTLSLSEDTQELDEIGSTANQLHGQLYQDIYKACTLKARKLEQGATTRSTALAHELLSGSISKFDDLCKVSLETHRQLTAYFPNDSKSPDTSLPVLVEFTNFYEGLNLDEMAVLKARVGQLCQLLERVERPSNLTLPVSLGFLEYGGTGFAVAYRLPEKADPHRDAVSLYSIIRSNKKSVRQLKSTQLWPTLEQRYQLAAILAEGVLGLLSVDWVHKALNSSSIVLYHEKGSVEAVDLSKPQMMGFGVARPDKMGEPTIDIRSINSPFNMWRHPQLRQGPHRRYERRYDIYSLGMILFEIGMWQDLHYYSMPQDTSFDFHQRVVNICHTQLAHHMGEPYRDVVLLCIDRDDTWVDASIKDASQGSLLELFSWEVVRILKQRGDGQGFGV